MTVIIPKKAYFTIIAASVRFANLKIPVEDWLEIYGLFIGKNKGEDVIISNAYPITHQDKVPKHGIDNVYWAVEDYESFAILDQEVFDNNKGEFTIGWFHSHPGIKVMMASLDIQTTSNYQQHNPLAISLVFSPTRLIRQIEKPDKIGDPDIQLENDPGFKIFRLDDITNGMHSTYHKVDYKIEGFDSMEQMIQQAQKFIIDITNFLPKSNLIEKYDKIINDRITQLNSLLVGTEEYLKTLIRQGESSRVPEVLQSQTNQIKQYVAETYLKIGTIKEFMDYLEYKERDIIIPQVNEVLSRWDEAISKLDENLTQLSNMF